MSQYKIILKSQGDPALIQFNFKNFLKKPISVATLDVFKYSAKKDIRILDKQDKNSFKNILRLATTSEAELISRYLKH
jgi:hypothetical protein